MADVQSTVLGSETLFVFAYWTNGSATSSNIYAKQVVTTRIGLPGFSSSTHGPVVLAT